MKVDDAMVGKVGRNVKANPYFFKVNYCKDL